MIEEEPKPIPAPTPTPAPEGELTFVTLGIGSAALVFAALIGIVIFMIRKSIKKK